MYDAAGDAKKTAMLPISSGSPMRPKGVRDSILQGRADVLMLSVRMKSPCLLRESHRSHKDNQVSCPPPVNEDPACFDIILSMTLCNPIASSI